MLVRIPSTVPDIKHQITQELERAAFNTHCCSEPAYIFCDVVAENDTSHGGFAGSAAAHEEDLFLFGLCFEFFHCDQEVFDLDSTERRYILFLFCAAVAMLL